MEQSWPFNSSICACAAAYNSSPWAKVRPAVFFGADVVEVLGVSSPNTPTLVPSESVNTAFCWIKGSPVASTVMLAATAGKFISDMRFSSTSEP